MPKKIKIYALSTCIWCKKTLAYFEKKGVAFEHIFVDELSGAEREKITGELVTLNPDGSYPTVVIDGKVIVGYQVAEFEKALKNER